MAPRRWILSLLTAVSFTLTACGGAADTPTAAPAPATNTAPAAAAATDTAPAAAAATNTAPAAGATNTTAAAAATNTTAPAAGAVEPTATLITTGEAGPDVLSVLSLWGGSEQADFQKVLDDFTKTTGIKTQYIQARDFIPALRTMIAAGNPPMTAIIPRPGVMTDLVNEGDLKELTSLGVTMDDIKASYSQAWIDLGSVNSKLYGIAVKANSKSTVWYHPNDFTTNNWQVPKTFDDLLKLSDTMVAAGKTPWAVGGGDSWTLTDLFEILYLRTAGPDKYNDLFQFGKLPFTDPTVVNAAQMMTKITNTAKYVPGGAQAVLGTKFVDGIGLVFGKTPTAEMYFEGGFVGGIATQQVNPDLKIGTDIDFFPFPVVDVQYDDAILGAGDQLSVFKDTPQSQAFLKYMISKQAGETWAKTGSIISPNKQVDPSVYPNDLGKKEAAQLGAATIFRFDGSDQLPGALGEDWGTALQGMVSNPSDIQKILSDFDAKAAREFGR
jgi:alpha-glucoside transport system substrate-binding protein